MATHQQQLRKGTAAQCDAMIPAVAELVVDTTNDRIRIGDASKGGGFHVPNANDIQGSKMNYAAAGGTANAITATYAPVPDAPADGAEYKFKASAANTGPTTFQPNYSGATPDDIVKDDGAGTLIALEGGELAPGGIYCVRRTGSDWHLQANGSPASGGWEEIATTSFGANPYIQFTGLDTDFSMFELQINELGAGAGELLKVQLGVDGGAVVTSSNQYVGAFETLYEQDVVGTGINGLRTFTSDGTGVYVMPSTVGAGDYYDGGNYRGVSGIIRITNPPIASMRPFITGECMSGGSAQPLYAKSYGSTKFSGANVTSIRIQRGAAGNFTHGVAILRGFREA